MTVKPCETLTRQSRASQIEEAQSHYYAQVYPWRGDPATSNWVTNLAHPCAYYGFAARTMLSPRPEERVLAMFEQGNDMEEITKIRLTRHFGCSWKLSDLRLRWEKYDITGRLDGIITLPQGDSYICEVKALAAHAYRQVEQADDFFGLSYWRHCTYPLQVLLYMWMSPDAADQWREQVSLERAILCCADKASSLLKPIWVYLGGYEEHVEAVIKRAEAVNAALKGGPQPDKLCRPSVCLSCDYQPECMPSLYFAAPLLAEDPEFLELLETRASFQEAGGAYDAADKELKQRMKAVEWGDSDVLMAGRFTVIRKVNKIGAVSFKIAAAEKKQEVDEDGE